MKAFQTPTDWKSAQWWRNRTSDERLFHLHIPRRIVDEVEGSRRIIPTEAQSFLDDWTPRLHLLIQGRVGTGKSYTAAMVARELIQSHPVSGRWVEADDYIDMLKDSFDNEGLLPEMYSSPHLIKYIKRVFDIVVIDGLGEERLTEFASHELGSLIRKRYDQNLSTIITTRLPLMDIRHRYGRRLANVLEDFRLETL